MKQNGNYNSKSRLCRTAWKLKKMRYNIPLCCNYKRLCLNVYENTRNVNCLVQSFWQVQKLQSIIASRASQYSHDAKRKEREAAKLKERLSQLLVDRKDKKLGKHANVCIYTHVYTFFVQLISELFRSYFNFGFVFPSNKLLMYWIVWDDQMEKEATGRLLKQQPGILRLSCHLLITSFMENVWTIHMYL